MDNKDLSFASAWRPNVLCTGAAYYSGCEMPLEDFMKLCQELGMEYLELQTEPPYLPETLYDRHRRFIRETAAAYQLSMTVHGPLADVNLSSLKESIRSASLSFTKSCLDLAIDLEAELFLVHAGVCPADQIRLSLEAAHNAFDRSLQELAQHAYDRGILLGVENKQLGRDQEIILTPDDLLKHVSEYIDLGVGVVFDTGHANTLGTNLQIYLKQISDLIIEIHLHDNNGVNDDHCALGKGSVPFSDLLGYLELKGFDGPVILELKSEKDLRDGVDYLNGLDVSSTILLSDSPPMPES